MFSLVNQKYLKFIIISLIIIILVYFILPVSYPILLAFVVALILTPIVRYLTIVLKIKRVFSVTIVFLLFFLFLIGLIYLTITQVISQGVQFFENLPSYITNINEGWNTVISGLETSFSDFPDIVFSSINDQINYFLEEMRSTVNQLDIISTVTVGLAKIPGYLISFIVFLITLFLFLIEMPRLKKFINNNLSKDMNERFQFMIARFSKVISGFLKAQFLVSIPIFLISLIGLLFISPKVALTMAIVIWIIDFIPLIGSIVILAPWATYLLLVGDNSTGIQLLVLAGILLIIRRTIEPKVMGNQIGLSPLATLISMYLGAQLLGITGLVLGPLIIIGFNTAKEAKIIKFPSGT
ncbi:sporulation integral membrane protein YtvI [Alkalicoccobacillus plakortidis]|uniref:Sporulation integral membrane protein YtvI n=1 Tax=Alkalicoccobacillus plakortidis TaxID=444060 RepID=A0ABT0XND2_9BACI|nr:sporulation integral membrane protein YtvI [Alkalicoccobacillus plakortidis]MCM2677419.1 sporulation integral membrane protein YtvI [Alkalicoccobacillus plakortidis]